MNKVFANADEAIFDITDDLTLLVGGFGLCGNPENLISALLKKGVKGLTIVSNNAGTTEQGLGLLLQQRQVAKMVSSYVGENKEFERQFLSGELEVELTPQGTLAERLRAGGCGIPAFYTATGAGTAIANGGLPLRYGPGGAVVKQSESKETRRFGDREYVLEPAITGAFSLVKAWKGDRWGNLVFRKTARNFNPLIAMAGTVCIAEVEELLEPGEIDADGIHLPGIYVHRILQGVGYLKPIEQRTTRPRP